MAHIDAAPLAGRSQDFPAIRKIDTNDLKDALIAGLNDFWAMPSHVFFLVIIYPVIGLVLARVTLQQNLLPLLFPLMAGFTLLGPFAAIGLYELSRRRQQGLPASLGNVLDLKDSPQLGAIAALGVVQMVIFVVWIAAAHLIYTGLFGSLQTASIGDFFDRVFTTSNGWALIVIGNGVGLLFAALALTLSVVSFPLLLDRNIGATGALMTSVRAVQQNPGPMALWGLIVAAALLMGSLPLFIGLAVVLPILGHATWHLYRRVVVPAERRF